MSGTEGIKRIDMAIALELFIKRVAESDLISRNEIAELLASLPDERQPVDGESCAELLVKEKKLSDYQAQQIIAGIEQSLVLNSYVILDKIGSGGMGDVFKASHKRMDRVVAIKIFPQTMNKYAATIQRFQREVQAAAKLTHPHIVVA